MNKLQSVGCRSLVMVYFMQSYQWCSQSRISRTPYPHWGHAVPGVQNSAVTGSKIKSRHHLAPQMEFQPSKLKYEELEISQVGDPLKEKCSCITVTLVPFESKVFTHYNCCWEPLWKQSSLLIHYTCYWAPLKAQGTLHITIAIVGPFESVVSLLTHYICYCGSLWKRKTYYSCWFWPFESRVGPLTECSCCWALL